MVTETKPAEQQHQKDEQKGKDFKAPEISEKDIREGVLAELVAQSVPMKTSEDAAQAYLRDLIDEDTLRWVVGLHGPVSFHWLTVDQKAAYGKELPEDIIWDKPNPKVSHDEEVKRIEEKSNERREATEKALQDTKDPLEKKALEADMERYYNPKTPDKK